MAVILKVTFIFTQSSFFVLNALSLFNSYNCIIIIDTGTYICKLYKKAVSKRMIQGKKHESIVKIFDKLTDIFFVTQAANCLL